MDHFNSAYESVRSEEKERARKRKKEDEEEEERLFAAAAQVALATNQLVAFIAEQEEFYEFDGQKVGPRWRRSLHGKGLLG